MEEVKKWQAGILVNNQYRIEAFLGKGGMGKTYRALDIKSGKKVALKLLCFSDIDDWKIVELFEREAKTLAALNHPLIPDYLDNFRIEEGKDLYYVLVQEYIDGNNLLDLIHAGKRFTIEEVEAIFKSLLSTIAYIHSLHPPVVHRDINPKNIIISSGNKVYLVDFGAVADPGKTDSGSTVVGTLGYMPQEQLYGKITSASDMYALGATIVFLLTGKEPSELELKNMRLDYHNLIDIPASIQTLLDYMLDPDYNRRLADAKKALAFLEGKEPLVPQSAEELEGAENVILKKTEEGFKEIAFKKKKSIYIFLIFFSIMWDSFLFFFLTGFGESEGGLPLFVLIFMLPFFAAGIFMFVFILYGFFGNSFLILKRDELVYNNTIFRYVFKSVSIPYSTVRWTKVVKEYGSKGSVSHVLSISGGNRTLKIGRMLGLTEEDLECVKRLIDRETGIGGK
jgi:predicted Ser/Thr protein kinase